MTVNGAITAGSVPLTKTGTGALIFGVGATNDSSAPVTVSAGRLSINNALQLGDGSATNTMTLGANSTFESTGADVDLGANRSVTLTGSAALLVDGTNRLTLSGPLTVGSGGALTKQGTGTLVLTSPASSIAGGFRPAAGLTDLSSLPTALQAATLNLVASDTGTVDFGAVTALSLGGLTGDRDYDYGTRSLTIGGSNVGNTYTGALSGTGKLTKLGTANQVLGGLNAYTGATDITEGTLTLRTPNATFTGDIAIREGATLWVDRAPGSGYTDPIFSTIFGNAANNFVVDGGTFKADYRNTTGGDTNADQGIYNRQFIVTSKGGVFDTPSGSTINSTNPDQLRLYNAAGVFVGSGPLTKIGNGRLSLGDDSPGYSGAWTLNAGVLAAGGGGLGDASPGNTLTINGTNNAHWAITGDAAQNITLNGGTISASNGSRTLTGAVEVTASSSIGLNSFWQDAGPSVDLTIAGVLSGDDNLLVYVTRSSYDANSGKLILTNTANDYSGTFTVQKNLKLENNSATGTGKTLNTAAVVLQGGHLRLLDNGTGSNQQLIYGTNVTVEATAGGGDLAGTSTIYVDRSSGTNTGSTFQLGTLTLNGAPLSVTGANEYRLDFAGLTTFNGTGSQAINVDSGADLTLSGGFAGGMTLDKQGLGILRLKGDLSGLSSYAFTGGTLQLASEPAGAGRTITVPYGGGFGAAYAVTQANFLDRITTDSAGVAVLGLDSSAALSLAAFTAGLRLGASEDVNFTGTIAPAIDNTIRLGGGGGMLTLPVANTLTGTVNLDVGTNGTAAGDVVLAAANNFVGTITLAAGGWLQTATNASLGAAGNAIVFDGGGLRFAPGAAFDVLALRSYTNYGAGILLDTNGNDYTPSVSLAGSGAFGKYGAGTLFLVSDSSALSGAIEILGGAINVQHGNALGDTTGGTTVYAGGALELQGDISINGELITLNGTGVDGAGALRNISGTNEIRNSTTYWVKAYGGASIIADAGTLKIGNDVNTDSLKGGGSLTIGGEGRIEIWGKTSGISGTTKVGGGTVVFRGDPANSGTFTINAGLVELNHGGSTDCHFVINDGGALRISGDNRLGDGYNIRVNAGGTFDLRGSDRIQQLTGDGLVTNGGTTNRTLTLGHTDNDFTFGGIIQDGSSAKLALTKEKNNVLTLTGTNTYTGNTQISTGQIAVVGDTARLSSGGTVIVGDNNGNDESLVLGSLTDAITGTLDRFGDSATLRFNGTVPVTYNGAAVGPGYATNENAGNLDFATGSGILALVPAAGGEVQLTFAGLVRQNGTATGVVRGPNLGAAAGTPDSTRVLFVTPPAIIGGIVPFLMGAPSAAAPPDTFLGYDATNGLTPISAYAGSIAGGAGQCVSLGGGETVGTSTNINAVRVTGGTTTLAAGTTVTIASGAIFFTADGGLDGLGTINFGKQQGVLMASGDGASLTAAIDARLCGVGGLILGDAGDQPHTFALSGDNTIVGGIVVNNGILRTGSAGALGSAFYNDLTLRAGKNNVTAAAAAALQMNGYNLTVAFDGNDRLQGSSRIQNDAATPVTLTIFSNLTSDANDGVIEDGAGGGAISLVKRGTAELTLEGNNTYTGTTEILGGTLRLRAANGALSGTSAIAIRNGSTLKLRNEDSGNKNGDRLPDSAPVALHGGTLNFDSSSDGGQSYSENAGPLQILSGGNVVSAKQAASTRTSNIQFDNLQRPNMGAIVNFSGTGLGVDGRNRISFDSAGSPALNDGIIGGWAFYNGYDFASYSDYDVDPVTAGTQRSVIVATYDPNTTDASQGSWTASSNIKPIEDITLTGTSSITLNSVNLADGIDLDLNGRTLTIDTGGLLTSGATPKTIGNGYLTAGADADTDLIVRNEASSNVTLSAVITDNAAGAVGLTKTTDGTLTLAAENTYTGPTTVIGGPLNFSADNNLGQAPTTFTPDHLRIYNATLNLTANAVTLNGNRGIELGGPAGTLSASSGANLIVNNPSFTFNGMPNLILTGHVDIEVALTGGNALPANFEVRGTTDPGQSSDVVLWGMNNVIGGSLRLGADAKGVASLSYGVAGGSLSIGTANPNASNIDIGVRDSTTAADTIGTLNLEGSENFTARVNEFRLAVPLQANGSNNVAAAIAVLARNNDIQALTRVVLSESTQEPAGASSLKFGSGTNNVVTPLLKVGGRKGEGRYTSTGGTVTIAEGGVLNLSGFAPGTGDLYVAYNDQDNTGVTSNGTFDMTGGTLVADLDEIVVGFKSGNSAGNGGAKGALKLDNKANVVTANSIRVADKTGGAQGAVSGAFDLGGGTISVAGDVGIGLGNGTYNTTTTGTLHVSGGSLNVGGNVTLAERASNGTSNGTLNLTGGVTTVTGNITTTNSSSAHATLTLDGGTLDVTGGTISVDTFNAQAGALKNVAEIFAGDGATPAVFNKTTSGTLTLAGVGYSGDTYVQAGTLVLLDGGINGNGSGHGNTTVALNDQSSPSVVAIVAQHIRQDTLTINANGSVTIAASGGPPGAAGVNFLDIADGSGGFTCDAGGSSFAPASFGVSSGSGSVSAVPEPATWLMVVMAAVAGLIAWRRR